MNQMVKNSHPVMATTLRQIELLRNAAAQEYSGEEHAASRVACDLAIDALEHFLFGTARGHRGISRIAPTGVTCWRPATEDERAAHNCDSCELPPDFVCVSATKDDSLVGGRRCSGCRRRLRDQQIAIFGEG